MMENIIIEVYGVSNLGIVSITIMVVSFFWFLVHISKNEFSVQKMRRTKTNEEHNQKSKHEDGEDFGPEDGNGDEVADFPEGAKTTLEEGMCPICGDEIDKENVDWEAGQWGCQNCDS